MKKSFLENRMVWQMMPQPKRAPGHVETADRKGEAVEPKPEYKPNIERKESLKAQEALAQYKALTKPMELSKHLTLGKGDELDISILNESDLVALVSKAIEGAPWHDFDDAATVVGNLEETTPGTYGVDGMDLFRLERNLCGQDFNVAVYGENGRVIDVVTYTDIDKRHTPNGKEYRKSMQRSIAYRDDQVINLDKWTDDNDKQGVVAYLWGYTVDSGKLAPKDMKTNVVEESRDKSGALLETKYHGIFE